MTRKPDFFLIGAPKCGTTSVAALLSQHPSVFMSKRKEPSFFSRDIYVEHAPKTLRDYERLFHDARPEHIAVGEASTAYLRSQQAVPSILQYNPNARFLVCLRNPVDMVASVHMQLLKKGRETETCLSRAWELQNDRANGRRLPKGERNPELFLYGKICSLGDQMQRLLTHVSLDRVCVVFLEDLRARPEREYSRIFNFLGVQPLQAANYPVENRGKIPHSIVVARMLRRAAGIKNRLGIVHSFRLGDLLENWNTYVPSQERLPVSLRRALEQYFKDDIAKLGALLGRDLRHWTSASLESNAADSVVAAPTVVSAQPDGDRG